MLPASRALLLACLSVCLPAASAQQLTVVPVENVRIDYAQVLSVEPVYQTLRATRAEQQCDDAPAAEDDDDAPKTEGRIARMVDSVKGIFSSDAKDADKPVDPPKPVAPVAGQNCRMVTVEREFRRPIAYDVDYVYKGTKYRSRLPDDPGNRLRIRVSVTPYAPGMQRAGNP